jgi:CRP-like cAMP-binding protein
MDPQTPLTTVEKAAFLTEVDLFRDVPSDALAELAMRMEDGWHEPGDVLLEPDMPDVRFWVVLSGTLRVTRLDASCADIGRGDAFGLLASLGLPQLETITAAEPCRTLSVAPDEYLDAIADSTAFAIANLRALGRRVRACEQDLRPPASPPPDGDGTL